MQSFNVTNRSDRNIQFAPETAEGGNVLRRMDKQTKHRGDFREVKSLGILVSKTLEHDDTSIELKEHTISRHLSFYSPRTNLHRSYSDGDVRPDITPTTPHSPPYSNFARYLPCLSTPSESSSTSFASLSVSESVRSTESSFRLPISASQLSLPEPPDGGWGWVIVFAAFFVHMITEGVIVSFGIFIEDLADEFQESMSATSWVGSFSYGIPALVTPVSSFFLNRFGCRVTCMLGALVSAVGCLAGCFANSLLTLVFTFGILSGLGSSLSMTAALVIVSMYFDDRRATATGLSIAGTGVGALVFAPAVEFFIEIYTWRGTFMLLAGALLHIAICGALMRPVETNMERKLRQRLAWLEHFAKGSGLPPLSKTADYIDRDIHGRIKLLRDTLLAPRKSSGRAHAVVRMPKDVCSQPGVLTSNVLSVVDKKKIKKSIAYPDVFVQTPDKSTEERELHTNCATALCIEPPKLEPIAEELYGHQTLEHAVATLQQLNDNLRPQLGGSIQSLLKVNPKKQLFTMRQISLIASRLFHSTSYVSRGWVDQPIEVKYSSLPAFHSLATTCNDTLVDDVINVKNCENNNFMTPCHNTVNSSSPHYILSKEATVITKDPNERRYRKTQTPSDGQLNKPANAVPITNDNAQNGRLEVLYRSPLLKAFGLTRESLCRALSLPDLSQVHRIRRRSGSSESTASSSSLEESCFETTYCGCLKRDESGQDDVPCEDCFIIYPLTKLLTYCGVSIPDLSGRHLCKQLCDLRLCRRYSFDLFICSNVLLYFWYNVTYFFMGVHGIDLGFSETRAALLFSVLGGANMVGEIVVGLLADREWVDALTLYLFMLLACGISTAVVPLLKSFLSMSFYASVFGFGLAANDALCTILLVEFVGLHHLTNALGMCFFCQGVANIIGPPTIGFIIDSTGSQGPAFFISGVGLILSGLVVIPIILGRYRRRRARRLQRKLSQQQREQQQKHQLDSTTDSNQNVLDRAHANV